MPRTLKRIPTQLKQYSKLYYFDFSFSRQIMYFFQNARTMEDENVRISKHLVLWISFPFYLTFPFQCKKAIEKKSLRNKITFLPALSNNIFNYFNDYQSSY